MSSPPASGWSMSREAKRAFSETVDPTAYVPREATDVVLAGLESWAGANGAGSTVAALIGRPGLGKTFMLRSFEARLAESVAAPTTPPRALYLPYASLSITDLCLWIYGLMGRSIRLPDGPESSNAALAALGALAAGPRDPFILLVDDADSMPQDTLRVLAEGLPSEGSALRILVALNDDAKASRLMATLDQLRPRRLSLGAPMNTAETALYVGGRIRWAAIPADEAALLDPAALRKIHSLSGGIPRSVHRIAASILETRGAGLPSVLDEKDKRENWMGQPIEDEL